MLRPSNSSLVLADIQYLEQNTPVTAGWPPTWVLPEHSPGKGLEHAAWVLPALELRLCGQHAQVCDVLTAYGRVWLHSPAWPCGGKER